MDIHHILMMNGTSKICYKEHIINFIEKLANMISEDPDYPIDIDAATIFLNAMHHLTTSTLSEMSTDDAVKKVIKYGRELSLSQDLINRAVEYAKENFEVWNRGRGKARPIYKVTLVDKDGEVEQKEISAADPEQAKMFGWEPGYKITNIEKVARWHGTNNKI